MISEKMKQILLKMSNTCREKERRESAGRWELISPHSPQRIEGVTAKVKVCRTMTL